jgi:fructokinase
MNKVVVGIGEILWDILPNGKMPGGAVSNFIFHLSQFGFESVLVSAVGNDKLGDELKECLRVKNLNFLFETVDYPTGTVNVRLSDKGIPQYEICENVAWDNIPFTSDYQELAHNTKAFCFGSLAQRSAVSRNTIRYFLLSLPENTLKIFDINLRQQFYTREIIEESLNSCNILKINDEEIVMIAHLLGWKGLAEPEICFNLIEKYLLNMVILTKGTKGSFIITLDETYFQPAPYVKVVDTVGAGDSFAGAFVASVLKGKSIAEAHEIAVKVSAYVCTQHGAMPILPDYLTTI